jgi:hypothetical protein
MAGNLFVSYSRREVGFVDDLVRNLEEKGYSVWLDYRNLVPGTPWLDQIHKGIHDSDDILLVVSKASLASQNVEVEWRRVLEQKKRIILLIFEAVDLPPELEKYEWVDFRGSYKAGLEELFSQLEQPIQEEHPVPQTGFKVPRVVWGAAFFSVIVGFFSLFSFWTLFIPWLLALLPYRIFKRDFNFMQVQAAILLLPFALFITILTLPQDQVSRLYGPFFLSFIFGGILLYILRSPAMQRWGKEQATMPRFSNPYKPDNPNPTPVPFFVDYAPEDDKVADELTRVLKKYGHTPMERAQDAKAVFVLLSQFKDDTVANPEEKAVLPIVIQTGQVSQKLSRIQWIDMRTGLHGLNAIAQLLPEPEKLLKALGNRPRGNQLILPAPITAMYYFLVLLGVFVVGSFFKLISGLILTSNSANAAGQAFGSVLLPYLFNLTITGLLIYFMTRTILQRRGRLARFGNFSIALLFLGGLLLGQLLVSGDIIGKLQALDANADASAAGVIGYPMVVYVIGVVVMGVFLFFRRRDIMFWFPAKIKHK